MAKIKKIKEGTATVYPATIPQAVIDPTSGKSVRTELNEKEAVANKKQTVTNSATDYPSGAAVTTSLALKTDISELNKIYPLYNYNIRVGLDSGLIKDLSHLTDLYRQNLSLLDSTVFLWNGEAGAKRRTSGSNTFASKLYNMANKVQQFGAELVTNGTFTTDTGWTKGTGWSISGGVAVNLNGIGSIYQAVSLVSGKTYHITYTISNYVSGSYRIELQGGTTVQGSLKSANGIYTESFVALSGNQYVAIYSTSSTGSASFDNISVKQMDWVDGTNDAVQTTEANQPYLGGLIAPNEVGKLKGLNAADNRRLDFSRVVFTENDTWSVSFAAKIFSSETQTIIGDTSNLGYIKINHNTILVNVRVSEIAFTNIAQYSDIGKAAIYTITCTGNSYLLYKEGKLLGSAVKPTGSLLQLNQLMISFNTSSDLIGELPHLQIFNRALSASEIQAQHDFLRLQIPEIEGIAIGNQYWATSNYEAVVAGDGSVIQEVQNSDNVEKITDIRDREFSEDTGWWTKGSIWTISSGRANYSGTGSESIDNRILNRVANLLTLGKLYRLRVTATVTSGTLLLRSQAGNTFTYLTTPFIVTGSNEIYFIPTVNLSIGILAAGTNPSGWIDDVSLEEVGWSQSTALYDAVYAQTSGTAAQKELAALKAAAMWCYYNNDVNNGAIYGKLYSWYAVKLISLYPPQGYRVPSSADFTQLVNYLGGPTVAGGKLKKEGLTYWDSPNTGATNESGFSGIGNGRREAAGGSFVAIKTNQYAWGDGNARLAIFYAGGSVTNDIYSVPRDGYSLRLLRNSPVGPNEKTITSTTIVSDIASTANSTQIPFGYSVASIRLKTTANLTNIKVELWNNFYSGTPTLVSTLITGKTANNTTMVFPVLADAAALLQDGTLRITATGAATFETIVEYNLQKNTF